MDRRRFLQALRIAGMGPGLPWSFKEGRDLARPNVVMILVDDMGWTDLGCYGNELHDTPMLDRLAQEGTRFTNAYASAPNCSPTRSAILTGHSPATLNITSGPRRAPRRAEAAGGPPPVAHLSPNTRRAAGKSRRVNV